MKELRKHSDSLAIIYSSNYWYFQSLFTYVEYNNIQSDKIEMKTFPNLTEEFIQSAIANPVQKYKCPQIHPGVSCNQKMIYQFISTSQGAYKVYFLVHFINLVINYRKLKEKPSHTIIQFAKGFCKSLLFAAGHMTLARRIVCLVTQYYKFDSISTSIGTFLGAVTVNFQPVGRQAEIALYCVNKSFQTLYHMARRRGYPVRLPYGEGILLGVATALICLYYVECPKAIRKTYLRLLQILIGEV